MAQDDGKLIPASTPEEMALDIASFVGSTIPWIGGPVSNVLGRISISRKFARVTDVLKGLVTDLTQFKSDASEEYVKTEDFEELLKHALLKAADERYDKKRQI